jgi:hypothetical protein
MEQPRVLLLAHAWDWINPTRTVLLSRLAQLPELTIIGRGYEEPLDTLAAMTRRHGRFDVLAVDSSVFLSWTPGAWPLDLQDTSLPKMVLNLLDDVHGSGPDNFRRFRESNAVVLSTTTGWQFFDPSRVAELSREAWIRETPYVFVHPEVIDERYILFPHCVEESEFLPVPASYRYDISVPGVAYWFRSEVAKAALHARLRRGPHRDLLQKVLSRMSGHPSVRRMYMTRFKRGIHHSRVTATCDGTVGYAIRKFFEIPAFGSVLAGRFFRNAEALGFATEENCFMRTTPEDIVDVATALADDPSWARRVAVAGQEMVRQLHSASRRAEQFMAIAAGLTTGRFKTAKWDRGAFTILEHHETT